MLAQHNLCIQYPFRSPGITDVCTRISHCYVGSGQQTQVPYVCIENALPMEPSSQLTDQIFDAFNFYPQSYFAHSFCKSQQIYAWHRGLFNHGDMNFHTYGTLSAK